MALSFWKKMFGGAEGDVSVPADNAPVTKADAKSEAVIADAAEAKSVETVASEAKADDAVVTLEEDEALTKPEELAEPKDISGLVSFVDYVARKLVDNPDAVSVATVEKERLSVIQIRCEKKDIGKLIGKNGKTIAAIRLLVSGAGGRMGLRMTVDVLD